MNYPSPMYPSSQLPEIECEHWNGSTMPVYVLHGNKTRGIGYCDNEPVVISAGILQPGTKMAKKWQWGDGSGRYFSVDNRGIWCELNHGCSPESGWSLY